MRTITITKELYKFEELTEEAKEKALDSLRDTNVDWDWWDCEPDWFNESSFNPIGLSVSQMYFDLDRADYIAFDSVDVVDARALLKAAGYDLRTKEAKEALLSGISITFETNTNLAAGRVTAGNLGTYENMEKIEELVYSTARKCLAKLRAQYEYLLSDEAIIETIEANEWEFTREGALA